MARRRIRAVWASSTMNVLIPAAASSLAPMRTKTASTGVSSIASAGTQQPICAMMVSSPTERTSELLPPMFGPVTTMQRTASVASSIELGT